MKTNLRNKPKSQKIVVTNNSWVIYKTRDVDEWFLNLEAELIQRQKNIENHLNSYNQGIYDFITELRGVER